MHVPVNYFHICGLWATFVSHVLAFISRFNYIYSHSCLLVLGHKPLHDCEGQLLGIFPKWSQVLIVQRHVVLTIALIRHEQRSAADQTILVQCWYLLIHICASCDVLDEPHLMNSAERLNRFIFPIWASLGHRGLWFDKRSKPDGFGSWGPQTLSDAQIESPLDVTAGSNARPVILLCMEGMPIPRTQLQAEVPSNKQSMIPKPSKHGANQSLWWWGWQHKN